jgi:hypothetical protein
MKLYLSTTVNPEWVRTEGDVEDVRDAVLGAGIVHADLETAKMSLREAALSLCDPADGPENQEVRDEVRALEWTGDPESAGGLELDASELVDWVGRIVAVRVDTAPAAADVAEAADVANSQAEQLERVAASMRADVDHQIGRITTAAATLRRAATQAATVASKIA